MFRQGLLHFYTNMLQGFNASYAYDFIWTACISKYIDTKLNRSHHVYIIGWQEAACMKLSYLSTLYFTRV